jgi:pyruvate dehydrogenase E2 component (dihydrolipoamide acetyltransferase)
MPTPILMPALSPTMEKGKLAKWLKHEGDTVRSGDVVAEIETDKATMEVEAVDEGRLGRIIVPEGTDDVAVNTPIAMILADGEDASAIAASTPQPVAAKAAEARPAETKPAEAKPAEARPAEAKPQATAPAPKPAASPAAEAGAGAGDGRIFASPLARRMAKEAGIDIRLLKGSGPNGRIVKVDIEKAGPQTRAEAPAAARAPVIAPAMSDEQVMKLFEPGSFEIVPHDGMRRTIGTRLLQAKQTIPHFYLTVDCALDTLLEARATLNDHAGKDKDGNPLWKLSVNDFLIKALGLALKRVPDANVTWTENALLKHSKADVGVAVAIEGGLFTPVIRNADQKSLSEISQEMKELAAKARKRRLAPHEYQGGTTALSNLGMFGIRNFDAVINPPHATILAVGVGEKRPVVVDDRIEIRTMMTVTLSCDHRAVDGALGARFLDAFKAFVEQPVLMVA